MLLLWLCVGTLILSLHRSCVALNYAEMPMSEVQARCASGDNRACEAMPEIPPAPIFEPMGDDEWDRRNERHKELFGD